VTLTEHEAVMDAVCDATLAQLPPAMPLSERTMYANLIRRDVARRLAGGGGGSRTATSAPLVAEQQGEGGLGHE
jgi:hypothetical protein